MSKPNSAACHASKKIHVIVKGWPRLSETFIAQEILGLQALGYDIQILAEKRGNPVDYGGIKVDSLDVTYIPRPIWLRPLALGYALFRLHQQNKLCPLLKKIIYVNFNKKWRLLGKALWVYAHQSKADVVYAHFLHDAGTLAWILSQMQDIPLTISAHAKDIYTTPTCDIRTKIEQCTFLVTCTLSNAEYLRSLSPNHADKIHLVYHGLSHDRSIPVPPRMDLGSPLRLVGVGRLVEKKGLDDLLQALALLPDSLEWQYTHIGEGALLENLKSLAHGLGLSARITWMGAVPQAEVIKILSTSDIFLMTSKIDTKGDRDGLPNVLMEAMIAGLPCIGTRVSAIPELITHEQTGLLVESGDKQGLADSIMRYVEDQELRLAMATQGQTKVVRDFSFEQGLSTLDKLFQKIP
jgi:glycosyltransferase involved in cell wall biosynthesis